MANDSGLCGCGCGNRTKIATRTSTRYGWIKGQPQPYLRGHAAWRTRGPKWVENENGCWIWQRALNPAGYAVGGLARYGKTPGSKLVHRTLYEQYVGPIPDGLELDHLCRTPTCVNPAHMEPVTGRVNVLRSSVTKVQDSDVARMYEMRYAGMKWREIAAQFGTTHPPLIVRMRRWCTEQGLPYPGNGRRGWHPAT